MADDDIASILFPNEGGAPPRQQATPAQTLARARAVTAPGTVPDAASILFGSGAPKETPQAPMARQSDKPASEDASAKGGHNPFAASEGAPDVAASVAQTLEPWATTVHNEGDPERAAEIREVGETLSQDFREAGMTAQDISEVMELAKDALGNTLPGIPMDEARLTEGLHEAEAFVREAGIPAEDIALAQRLVRDMDRRTNGRISEYLNATGMGNDPRTIRKAVEVARQRYR